jgi:nucleoside-diphosphate-sugar epimerase
MEVWRGIHEGLNAIIVNPSVIIGPGMWLGPGKQILSSVSRGLRFYPSGSSGYVDVRDVAQIMILLAEGETKDERYIINGENLAHKTLMDLMAEQMNSRKPTWKITWGIARIALIAEKMRAFLTGTSPRISHKTLEIAFENLDYSNEKIKKIPGVQFIPISESIAFTVEMYLTKRP